MMTYIETRWYTCCWLLVISITICMCVHCTIMLLFWEGLLGYSLAPPATLAAPLCYPEFRVANSFNSKQLLCPEALIPCRSNILLAMFFYCPTLDFVLDMDNRKLSFPPNCGQKEAILFFDAFDMCVELYSYVHCTFSVCIE